ncbi:S8 family serine peptidase [Alteromonas confluentis]|uniref:Peptidase S8 n=1 Tax=Alteromonas confluentis TaxID=1656094 RepID=A0A1E7Z9N0_9ALTE|nr:S8 family serine peptidase [Alteromonas confluentis]OFC70238.1 peptidase S8 [Alteromonas confluentis]
MKKKLSALTLAMLPALGMAAPTETVSYEDDSIIVVYKASATEADRNSAMALINPGKGKIQAGAAQIKSLMKGRAASLNIGNMGVKKAIETLKKHPAVLVAEPNYRVKADFTPNDEFFSELWGLSNSGSDGGVAGADISAEEAWDITTGSSDVVIGVIDTGVDYMHEDLAANAWTNPGEIPGNGIDDDMNGYVDDVYGIDAVNDDSDPMDDHYHGTHVAGTIGAVGDNGIGVVGVNHDVSIAACKFLDAEGYGSTDDAIECIDYFTALKEAGVNIKATNNSWGGGAYSEALEMSIEAGVAADILFVAAAGNSGANNDVSPHYPSSYASDGVFAIAATTRTDGDSFYSYGPTTVDLAAPGVAIYSTIPPAAGYGEYEFLSGTSMATPHVSGALALVLAANPALSVLEVKEILMESGDDNEAMAEKILSGKRLNVAQALADADPTPRFGFEPVVSDIELTAGEMAEFTFMVTAISDWEGTVDLSVADSLGTAYLSTTTAMPGDMVTLYVPTTEETPWGTYAFSVTGTSGELTDSESFSLSVLPVGLYEETFSNTTPVDIPDSDPAGITSVITVDDAAVVFGAEVFVDITHTWIGDLIVTLTSPAGTEYVLHNREGGSADDIYETYEVEGFNGEMAMGDWTLFVSDNVGYDTGTLNQWAVTLTMLGEGDTETPPSAGFEYAVSDLTVSFTDTSTDPDDDITTWEWSFGDGSTSSETSPVYTYAEPGSYEVTLMVTDSEGQSDSMMQVVTVEAAPGESDIETMLRRTVIRGNRYVVAFGYKGAVDSEVSIYKDGVMIGTKPAYRGRGSYEDRGRVDGAEGATYKVCDSSGCSAEFYVPYE